MHALHRDFVRINLMRSCRGDGQNDIYQTGCWLELHGFNPRYIRRLDVVVGTLAHESQASYPGYAIAASAFGAVMAQPQEAPHGIPV
jgi:hypothetical protein